LCAVNRTEAVQEAQRLIGLNDVDHAVAKLQQLAAEFPKEPEVLLLLASALVTKGELEDAARTAARAADLRRDDPTVVFRAAHCVRWFSVPAGRQYIDHTKRLLADAGRKRPFLFGAELLALDGQVAFDEGDPEAAVQLLEEAHQREPGSGFIARDLAEVTREPGGAQTR
jgi:tetratricopeptide (TPR) repeat protein